MPAMDVGATTGRCSRWPCNARYYREHLRFAPAVAFMDRRVVRPVGAQTLPHAKQLIARHRRCGPERRAGFVVRSTRGRAVRPEAGELSGRYTPSTPASARTT